MTSTLQQEAGRKLRFSAQRAMQVAQRLYEQGCITYMRTDSTTLSDEALDRGAHARPRDLYGDDYVPDAPRRYERKVKNAQEAHEAIRPAGETFRTPDQAGRDALGRRAPPLRADLEAHRGLPDGRRHRHQRPGPPGGDAARAARRGRARRPSSRPAAGSSPSPGSCRAYVEGAGRPRGRAGRPRGRAARADRGRRGRRHRASSPRSHTTQPPARYTEASLVKAMEELGVGRPSTYASVIATILDRGYVWKKGTALVPSFTAFAVVGLLERTSPTWSTTASPPRWRTTSTRSPSGREESLPWLTRFYFGDRAGRHGATATTSRRSGSRRRWPPTWPTSTPGRSTPSRSAPGPTASRSWSGSAATGPTSSAARTAPRIPEDLAPDELTIERAEELLAAPSNDRVLGTDPETGLDVQVKAGRFGPYVQLGEVVEGGDKPKTASLFSTMDAGDATLDAGPRAAAASRGRSAPTPTPARRSWPTTAAFGPYLKRGTDTRSLASEDQLFTVTLDEALALFAQPKQRPGPGGGAAAARAGRRPGDQPAGGGQGGPLRALRDRRRHQRLACARATRRVHRHRARRRAAGRAPGRRALDAQEEGGAKKAAPAKKKAPPRRPPAKKAAGEEGGGQEERQPRPRRPPSPRATAAKADRPSRSDVPARGRLIALEGIDGCGKSTQAARLAERARGRADLRARGHAARARALRALLLAPDAPAPSPRAEALLMAADRAQHVAEVIEPALAAGRLGGHRPLRRLDHRLPGLRTGPRPGRLARAGRAGPPAGWPPTSRSWSTSASRWRPPASPPAGRGAADRLEQLGADFADRVRHGFLAQAAADPAHWLVVDGTADVEPR